MSRQFSLPYMAPPSVLLAAAADAAGRASPYRSLKHCLKAYLVCEVNQGNAATVALTPMQAQDVSGTNAKVINAAPIWLNDATATSDALVAQVAAANFTTDANTTDKLVIFEILTDGALDVNNGFNAIGITTGASNAANITRVELIVLTDTWQATPPSTFNN